VVFCFMVASPFIPAATGLMVVLVLQPKGYAASLVYTPLIVPREVTIQALTTLA